MHQKMNPLIWSTGIWSRKNEWKGEKSVRLCIKYDFSIITFKYVQRYRFISNYLNSNQNEISKTFWIKLKRTLPPGIRIPSLVEWIMRVSPLSFHSYHHFLNSRSSTLILSRLSLFSVFTLLCLFLCGLIIIFPDNYRSSMLITLTHFPGN